jgi:hypothetical protein
MVSDQAARLDLIHLDLLFAINGPRLGQDAGDSRILRVAPEKTTGLVQAIITRLTRSFC